MTITHDTATDPDTPVPFTLTGKAHAFLDITAHAMRAAGTAVVDGALCLESAFGGAVVDSAAGWACGRCGAGWFGTPSGDGQCPGCRDNA